MRFKTLRAFLIFSLLFLTACVTTDYSQLTESEIRQLPYEQVCQSGAEVYDNISKERKRRNLSCSYPDDFCRTQAGLKKKTKEYGDCLIKVQELQLQQQKQQNIQRQIGMLQLQQGVNQMQQSNQINQSPVYKPLTTQCRNSFNGFNCTTF